MEIGSS